MITPRALACTAALLLAGPAAAHEPINITPNFNPTISWFDFPVQTLGSSGRVRLVSADGLSDVALDLDEYYFYQLRYRKALAHLVRRMSFHQAEPLARRQAVMDTLREFPDVQMNVAGATRQDINKTLRLLPANLIPGT